MQIGELKLSTQAWATLQAEHGVTVVLVTSYIGDYVVRYLRGATSKDDTDAADLTVNFEEMRREGDISDADVRTIESVVGKTQSSGLSSDPRTN